jgi:hypothetical protein
MLSMRKNALLTKFFVAVIIGAATYGLGFLRPNEINEKAASALRFGANGSIKYWNVQENTGARLDWLREGLFADSPRSLLVSQDCSSAPVIELSTVPAPYGLNTEVTRVGYVRLTQAGTYSARAIAPYSGRFAIAPESVLPVLPVLGDCLPPPKTAFIPEIEDALLALSGSRWSEPVPFSATIGGTKFDFIPNIGRPSASGWHSTIELTTDADLNVAFMKLTDRLKDVGLSPTVKTDWLSPRGSALKQEIRNWTYGIQSSKGTAFTLTVSLASFDGSIGRPTVRKLQLVLNRATP